MSRKSHFNAAETNKLLEVCSKYRGVVECTKSDCITAKEKEDVWDKIAQEFNGTNEIYRDAKELKKKYNNLKYSTKSKAAEERQGVYGTGGGPAATVTSNSVEKRMLAILNEKELGGVPNNADSDAVMEDQAEDDPDQSFDQQQQQQKQSFETPASGPTLLRKKISTPLFTPRKQGENSKSAKATSWEVLASIKTKWTEAKMEAEVSLAKKEAGRVELQMKLMREKQEEELLQCRERHAMEMEILSIRLQKQKLELSRLHSPKP